VIFSFDPAEAHGAVVTKTQSPQLLSFCTLTNRYARNSFRMCSYAKCRVSLAFSFQCSDLQAQSILQRMGLRDVCTPHKPFSCNTYGSPRKCGKQKTYGQRKPFRCNTYKKQGGAPSSAWDVSVRRYERRERLPCFGKVIALGALPHLSELFHRRDSIDYCGGIIRHQQRPIRRNCYSRRPPGDSLLGRIGN
jgi:hypothetical protein